MARLKGPRVQCRSCFPASSRSEQVLPSCARPPLRVRRDRSHLLFELPEVAAPCRIGSVLGCMTQNEVLSPRSRHRTPAHGNRAVDFNAPRDHTDACMVRPAELTTRRTTGQDSTHGVGTLHRPSRRVCRYRRDRRGGGTDCLRWQQTNRTHQDHHDDHDDHDDDHDAVDDSSIAAAFANRECAQPQRAEFVLPRPPLAASMPAE